MITELLKGIDESQITARTDGTVFTLHNAEGATVAEVCVGTKKCRANFKAAPKDLKTSGKAKNWSGGGVVVTAANLPDVRKAIAACIAA